jgi:hypothetical protein
MVFHRMLVAIKGAVVYELVDTQTAHKSTEVKR